MMTTAPGEVFSRDKMSPRLKTINSEPGKFNQGFGEERGERLTQGGVLKNISGFCPGTELQKLLELTE